VYTQSGAKTGLREGEHRSINQKRQALNAADVLSADAVGKLFVLPGSPGGAGADPQPHAFRTLTNEVGRRVQHIERRALSDIEISRTFVIGLSASVSPSSLIRERPDTRKA